MLAAMLAATFVMVDEVGGCPEDVNSAAVWLEDSDGCNKGFEVTVICGVGGDVVGASLEDSRDCSKEFGVAVICVVEGAEIPFPPAAVDVILTAEVALAMEVALAATVTNPERSAPNSDESRLGRRALKADTSSASSEIEAGSIYRDPE